jgi:hypothetical protein
VARVQRLALTPGIAPLHCPPLQVYREYNAYVLDAQQNFLQPQCPQCARTFFADRLLKHMRTCCPRVLEQLEAGGPLPAASPALLAKQASRAMNMHSAGGVGGAGGAAGGAGGAGGAAGGAGGAAGGGGGGVASSAHGGAAAAGSGSSGKPRLKDLPGKSWRTAL